MTLTALLHQPVQRVFAFTEGKTAGVEIKGLCGKTWRAAAQWCNTVGCSGWCVHVCLGRC